MSLPVRSMTGFATVAGQATDALSFTLSVKSVNHRFLDLHFRLPSSCDALEMDLRRMLKDLVHRGHLDITLQTSRAAREGPQINLPLLRAHVDAYRAAAEEVGVETAPDLSAMLRLPGMMSAEAPATDDNGALQAAVLHSLRKLIADLNTMRDSEGEALAADLRACMQRIRDAVKEVRTLRADLLPQIHASLRERLETMLQEVSINADRVLTEAALLADRGDVDEEMVRLNAHIDHFLQHLEIGGEVGKKLDFLMQEFNREANTLLSKTGGSAHTMRITELGLAIKSEIERAREQVQNLE